MVDKNLFLHDLAVVAILKNEGHYLKEWLDYHLLAGIDHFYLYDNDSTDNQAEVSAPYVKAGLVDYFHVPGKAMQLLVYNDAVKRFKFFNRYMAIIDGDEFIYPKVDRGACSITDVVDEILSHDKNAAGLGIIWHVFGSNGLEKADYSRGVLERFTRYGSDYRQAKTIAIPRKINVFLNPHLPDCFENFYIVNENGDIVYVPSNQPDITNKIIINHYIVKSKEEYLINKVQRGRADLVVSDYDIKAFSHEFANDIFEDGILHYRAARAENFSLEDKTQRLARVIKALTETLSTFAAEESSPGKMETALTCRALSTYLREKFLDDADRWKLYEEASLKAILRSFNGMNLADAQLLIRELPALLSLPYPAVKDIRQTVLKLIPQMMNVLHLNGKWRDYVELDYIQDMLKFKEAE